MRVDHSAAFSVRFGSIIFEAMILLPLLGLVVLGAIEFSRGVTAGQAVAQAADVGALLAETGATPDAVARAVRGHLEKSLGIAAGDVSVVVTPEPATDETRGRIVVSVPYQKVGYVGALFTTAARIHGESSWQVR